MANTTYIQDGAGEEEWRPVVGWEGYEVSSFGNVRSVDRYVDYIMPHGPRSVFYKGKPLKARLHKGYPGVRLSNGVEKRAMIDVHVLVCEAFLGPRPTDHDVAHNDGNRTNNRLTNLRYATRKENMADCVKHGTRVFGQRHGRAKLTPEQAAIIRGTWDKTELRRLASEYGIHLSHAHQIRRGGRYQMETR